MGNSGSWRIVRRSLKQTIAARLSILPKSELRPDCQAQLELNRSLLVMLGKLPSDAGSTESCPIQSPQAVRDSAAELLQLLGSLIELFYFSDDMIIEADFDV